MPRRTVALWVLFLIGCPKGSESDAEIFHFAEEPRLPPPKSTNPIEVVAPGWRTEVRSLAVKGRIEAERASTEMTIELAQPTPPGARLSLLLPEEAEIERLAARVADRWIEASRRPDERSDRPLVPVTQAEPRLAPELPPETQAIAVAYREPLSRRYRVALRGLPRLESFGAEIATSTGVIRRELSDWTPASDLEAGAIEEAPRGEPSRIESLLVAIDSSASSAKHWERQIALARALVEALGKQKRVHVGLFDFSYSRVYEGPAGEMKPEHWRTLEQWRAMGVSSYGQMLGMLVVGKELVKERFSRMVLIGDGIATTGPRDPSLLVGAISRLAAIGVKRVDAIAFGEVRNRPLLEAMVAASPVEAGAVIDGDLPVREIARRLSMSAPPPIARASTSTQAPAFYRRSARQLAVPPAKPKLSPVQQPERSKLLLPELLDAYERTPFDPAAAIALGDAYAALSEPARAARAFGSLIDLFPQDPDLLALAGMRMDGLKDESALRAALDAYDRAIRLAPERPALHRLLAYALLKGHEEQLAFEVLERALVRVPMGPAQRILREDAAIFAAAWLRKEPKRRDEIGRRLIPFGVTISNQPFVSFSLYWSAEVDADLVVLDGRNAPAPLEGDSPAFGPEVAMVRVDPRQRAYPYRVEARVFGRAPLGATTGKLEIMEHDGSGGVWFSSRTFLITADSGIVDLGNVTKPFGKARGGP